MKTGPPPHPGSVQSPVPEVNLAPIVEFTQVGARINFPQLRTLKLDEKKKKKRRIKPDSTFLLSSR